MSTYIVFDGMAGKSEFSVFQNFFQIENQLNIKKVMGRNVWMCFVLTAFVLNALEILMPYVNTVNIYYLRPLIT